MDMPVHEQGEEEQLQAYWKSKLPPQATTDFDTVVKQAKRGPIAEVFKNDGDKTVHDVEIRLSRMILTGWPLTKAEYHLALAFGLLVSDASYLTFFKKYWHEADDHRGYGSEKECYTCKEKKHGRKASPNNMCKTKSLKS